MASKQAHRSSGVVSVDIPDEREYETAEEAELDSALVDAIRAAEAAGDEFLAQLLSYELGSHYHATR
jgi:hypothetical protein